MTKFEKSLGGVRSLGFTLAEVLITLAVIGVVAALTIPTVVHKYQQKQMYTQFMKVYNTLSNSLNLSAADNGKITNWNYNDDDDEKSYFETYITPYLKVIKSCDAENISDCYDHSSIKTLGGEDADLDDSDFNLVYILADGSAIFSWETGREDVVFLVDTNGAKGPNTFGRDVFLLKYKDSLTPMKKYELGGERDTSHGKEWRPSSCDSSDSGSFGEGCADRLLQEGKMDY